MKWPLLTLGALLIAAMASVFAVWPAVTDAPWESSGPPTVDPIRIERCKADLQLRNDLFVNGVPSRISTPEARQSFATAVAGSLKQDC